jgi:hypothetical protein
MDVRLIHLLKRPKLYLSENSEDRAQSTASDSITSSSAILQYNTTGTEKVREILEYFVVRLTTVVRPVHAVAQGQTVICCECGSAAFRLC